MSALFADFILHVDAGVAGPGGDPALRHHSITADSITGGRALASCAFSLDEQLALDLIQATGSEPDLELRQRVGSALFERFFTGGVRDLWVQVNAQAAREGAGLRLRLAIDDPSLSPLPWELLRTGGEFLAARADTPVSRYLPVAAAAYLPPQESLRVLLVIQNPGGTLAITEDEITGLQSAMAELAPRIACTTLLNSSIADIQSELQQGYQVLHFLGHGDERRVFFLGPQRLAAIDDEAFAQLFSGRRSLRLVVLTACSSAQTDAGIFSGMGPALVQKRIPAVVAMQYKFVQLPTAALFSKALYRGIASGLAVDAAVNEARQLTAVGPLLATRDWSTPVLYMSTPVGRVIEIGADTVTDSWQHVKEAAAASVRGAAAIGEVSQRLAELATLQNDVLINDVKAGFALLSRIRAVSGAYEPCRALIARAGSPLVLLPLLQEVTNAWGIVGRGPLNGLAAYLTLNPAHRFVRHGAALIETAGAISRGLDGLAANAVYTACRTFDAELASTEVLLADAVDNAIQTLVTASAQTLEKLS